MPIRVHPKAALGLSVAFAIIVVIALLTPVGIRQTMAWLEARPSPVPATPQQQQAMVEALARPLQFPNSP